MERTPDAPLSWQQVAVLLDQRGRGARQALANRLSMDRSQLTRTLRGSGYPSTLQATIISRFFAGGPEAEVVPFPTPTGGAMRVPLFGFAAGSAGDRIAINEGQILDWIDLPRGMTLKGDYFVVQAIGSSMEPRIFPGERKLVQRNVPPARGQDAVIEFDDGTGVLKTYEREKDGQVFVRQYNPDQLLPFPSTKVKAMHAVFPL